MERFRRAGSRRQPWRCGLEPLEDRRLLAVVFSDDFPNAFIDAAKWPVVNGASVDTAGLAEPTAPYSLRFDRHPSGTDSIESRPINLQGAVSATVSYSFQRTGGGDAPAPGADLLLEYRNAQGTWVEAQRQLGGLDNMTTFALAAFVVPVDGLHAQFQFRFKNTGENVLFDDWFVDDVSVTTGPAEIRGKLYIDGNRDGLRDPEEQPLVGWTVFLDLNRDGRYHPSEPHTATAADGTYILTNLTPGPYNISVVPQSAWIPSAPASLGDTLTWSQSVVDGAVGSDKLSGAWSVALSPDGQYLYAASSGDDSLTVFRRDPVSGEISAVQTLSDGVNGVDGLDSARSLIVSPDGKMVLVASSNDDAVAGFLRNPANGQLVYSGMVKDGLENVDGMDGVWSLVMSPDGLDLYATGTNDDAVAVFHRETTESAFDFVERHKDGEEIPQDPPGEGEEPPDPIFLDGLDGPRGLVISPDGENVYVTGSNEHSIVVFQRNPLDGKLKFIKTYKDGQDDFTGLAGVFTLAISSDGKFIYASSVIDNALTVLSRNDANGELTVVETFVDGQAGVNGLDFVTAITITSDGTRLYTAASDDSAIGVFRRDTFTGKLTFAQALVDGQELADGLVSVRGLTVSSDMRHLYTASSSDHAISLYRVAPVYQVVARSGIPELNKDFGAYVAAPVWDGGGANSNWSTGANWASQTPPQPNDRLIFAGALQLSNNNDFPAGITYSSVTFSSSGFTLGGNRIVVKPLDSLAWLNSVGTNNVNLPWTLGASVASRVDVGTLTYAGQVDTVGYEWTIETAEATKSVVTGRIIGAGGLRKKGAGTLVIDGISGVLNSYSGATTLENGIVELRGAGRLGDVAIGTTLLENATLKLLTTATINEPLSLAGVIFGANGAKLDSVITFSDGARFEATDASAIFTINGALLNEDGGEVEFHAGAETSVLVLGFTADYDGRTRFTGAGTIRLGQASAIPDSSTVQIDADTTWDLNGLTETIAALTGGGTVALGAGRLTVNSGQGLSYDGIITGTGGITKNGLGTLVLSGAQTYTGATFVEIGTLELTGSLAGAVTVRNSGVLTGNGAAAGKGKLGALSIESGGKVAPTGIGTVVTGPLSIAAGGIVEMEVLDTASDVIKVTGAVNITGGTLNVTATVSPTKDSYILIDNDGSDPIVGTFTDVPEGKVISVGGALAYVTYRGGDGNDLAIVTTAAVSGVIYNDVNSDHQRQPTEPGLAGWIVFDDANGNGRLDANEPNTTTNSSGQFPLAGLSPGTHRITEVIKPGWTQSAPDISTTSLLRFVQFHRDGASGVDGLDGAWGLATSPDGKNIYATSVIDDALVVFKRNATTGELTFVEAEKDGVNGADGLDGAAALAVSPDGKHVYVAGVGDNSVTLYTRSDFDGAVTFSKKYTDGANGIDGIAAPLGVTVSPDGLHVFVAGNGDSAIAVFSRNTTNGELTFLTKIKDNDQNNGKAVDSLFGSWNVTVAPDNKNVYVTSNVDDAVTVFQRNPTNGELKYVQSVRDTDTGLDGLDGASGVLVSPDGKQVYVAADRDDSVAIFTRDPATGLLTFVKKLSTAEGVPRMDGANSLATNAEGTDVYVTSAFGDAVVVFARNPTNGDLTYVEYQGEGSAGVDGLDSARAVVVSPDGRNVYATGQNDDAVAVFARDVPYFLVNVAAGGQGGTVSFGNYRSGGGGNVPGDTDGNNTVDLQDLNNVRNSFGTGSAGDTDGDGDTDLEDLNAVRNNFGGSGAPQPLLADAVFHLAAEESTMAAVNGKTSRWRIR